MEAPQAASSNDTVIWHLTPEWRKRLRTHRLAFAAHATSSAGHIHVVKDGPHRTVYRLDLPEVAQTVYVKHYRCNSVGRMIAQFFRGSTARREWRKARELARRHIATVRPVGIGEQKRGPLVSDNYFVSEAVPHAITLDQYEQQVLATLSPTMRARQRRLLCESLARWTAKLHRSGVDHHDFHAGNILLASSPTASTAAAAAQPLHSPELLLVDLPCVAFSRPLNLRRSLASLTMLGSGLLDRVSSAERLRFLKVYLSCRDDLPKANLSRIARHLEARIFRRAQRVLRSRDKRAMRTNRDFVRLSHNGTTLCAVNDVPPQVLQQLLKDPEAPLRNGLDRPLKLSRRTVLVETTIGSTQQRWAVAYKRRRPQGLMKSLLAFVRPSAVRRSWQIGHALLARRIPTARPLVIIEPPARQRRSYLATEWVGGSRNLHLYLWHLAAIPEAEQHVRLKQTAESLGRLVGRLHRWTISHRDLKACNLMIVEHADRVESLLIDVDGIRMRRRLSHRLCVRNLARLAASIERHPWIPHTARLRFLKAYLRARGLPPQQWKWWWRRIRRQTQRHLRRFERHKQPVA